MAEKDMTEKTLESYNDVFADIANVLLFGSQRLIDENDLVAENPRSIYKADGKLHEQERDVAKYWQNGTIRIALFGFENQTEPDADLSLRLFSYDGAAYRAQLLTDKVKKSDEKINRYPIVTLALYFGYKKRWNKPTTLLGRLKTPEALKPFINDYKINLFEIAWLPDEQVSMFQSDFRLVADYFVQMRKNREYTPPTEIVKHVHEFLQLMSAMTGDNRYEEIYTSEMEGRKITMCEVLDEVENRGIAKGIEQGLEQGKTQIILKMLTSKMKLADIMYMCDVTKEKVTKIAEDNNLAVVQ